MSLFLYVSHTGQCYTVETSEIGSPEVLKQWIGINANIPVGCQILMNGAGKNVKQQHLIDNNQIYIYDKRFLLGDEPSSAPDKDEQDPKTLSEPPSELENESSLESWQHLFKARRAWALEAVHYVKNLSEQTATLSESCENIDRSAHVAIDNLKNHVNSLQSLYDKTQVWAQDTLKEHADMLQEWRSITDTLKELPIRDDIGQLMDASVSESVQKDVAGTMYALLNPDVLHSAESALRKSTDAFKLRVSDLAEAMLQLDRESLSAAALLQIEWPNFETENLVQEAETLAKKVDGDYNDVLRATSDTKGISKVSRVAAGHTNSLLPGLQEVAQESFQMCKAMREHKQSLRRVHFQVLRSISHTQSALATLQGKMSSLTVDDEGQQSLENLDRVFRLPSAYGSILIEAVRRSEWNERTVSDLKGLQNELSQHKDDELRRRKKWTNGMSTFLAEHTASHSTDANAISDFTFSTPSNPWPYVTREEIYNFVEDLRALQINDSVQQVTQQLRDLDAPSKPRRQRPKPFKNGSIHDTMQNSFIRTGAGNAEEIRALQDDKIRLEDKIRGSESRIRKLEDLLHRQSQTQGSTYTRPASGVFTPIAATEFERRPSSPGTDTQTKGGPFDTTSLSRRSSISHQPHARRLSNQTPEEKVLVQRIVSLEAQILTAKVDAENNLKAYQEADQIKRDLLANWDSARQEFEDERQRLEDDNHEAKIKLEEMEEELDRVVGSRDHEKANQEQAASHLRTELERVRRTANDEMDRLRSARENLERELISVREKYGGSEAHLQQLRAERSSIQDRNLQLANDIRNLENQQADLMGTLQSIHQQLSPAGSAPDEIRRLVSALEVLAEGSTIHARGLDDALQLATAHIKASDEQVEQLETKLQRIEGDKSAAESRLREMDETLAKATHSLDSARVELEEERRQVEQLRTRYTAGETGSDMLRARLNEEEAKVANLTELRDTSEVQKEILQQNMAALHGDAIKLKADHAAIERRLTNRQKKLKDLCERLFHQNDRMIRLLENFGYSVSREGDSLQIQRASKVNASQMFGDGILGTPMKRQISGSMPIQHYSDITDAQALHWTHDDERTEDDRFETFLRVLARLDLENTVELITKRYKDVETLAKKYQKDSRLNREKTHRLQSEAHEKITYKGFKEGDLALFLPTRNQATKPWAAFNVGAPHYFLKETDSHRLQHRDWLLARISKIEERVVDLSRSMTNASTRAIADASASDRASLLSLDDNPFELSDGLRWYMIEASEEKPGAPTTPGLGKSTVAASVVDVKAQMGRKSGGSGGRDADKATPGAVNAAKTLHKSLDSRRSSEASRKSAGVPVLKASLSGVCALVPLVTPTGIQGDMESPLSPAKLKTHTSIVKPSDADHKQSSAREDDRIFEVDPGSGSDSRISANPVAGGSSMTVSAKLRTADKREKPAGKPWDRLFSFQFQS